MSDTIDYDDPDFTKLKIVIATELDEAVQVLPLIKLAHKESYFADLPFETEVFLALLSDARKRPTFYGAFTVLYDDQPIGMAAYMYRPMLGSQNYWVTQIHTIYLRPDVRSTRLGAHCWDRMITTIKAWSLARGAKGITISATLGVAVEAIDSAAQAAGAVYMGGNYFLRL